MKPLYEITSDYIDLDNKLREQDEINEELMQQLDSVNDSMQNKVINIGALIKNMEAEAQSISSAVELMKTRQQRLNNKAQYLKDYLKYNMEVWQVNEVKSPYFDIKVKTNPPSVLVEKEELVPREYFKENVTYILDKIKLSFALKNNEEIPGASLIRKTRLEIA